jgi:hypothetical protein
MISLSKKAGIVFLSVRNPIFRNIRWSFIVKQCESLITPFKILSVVFIKGILIIQNEIRLLFFLYGDSVYGSVRTDLQHIL